MLKRAITALCLLAVAAIVSIKSGWWLWSWVLVVSLLTTYELFSMSTLKSIAIKILGYLMVAGIMVSTVYEPLKMMWLSVPMMCACFLVLSICFVELLFRRVLFPTLPFFIMMRIVIFVGLTFPYIYLLRDGHHGLLNFVFSLSMIWVCDTFALLGGRWLGKTPLSSVSPKKTWEGSIIGVLCAVGLAAILISMLNLPWVPYLTMAFVASIVGQIGDLHESLIKRHFNVKDSSQLLPGHGGYYDRADSTLFIAPIAFYFFNTL